MNRPTVRSSDEEILEYVDANFGWQVSRPVIYIELDGAVSSEDLDVAKVYRFFQKVERWNRLRNPLGYAKKRP